MRFRMLGPLLVGRGTTASAIPAAQMRTVLAVLLARSGRVVDVEQLIDEIWGARPPRRAVGTVQGYVMQLRRVLDDGRDTLVTRGHGYELHADPSDVDAKVFEKMVELGRHRLAQGEVHRAADVLAEGLALWRGPALADVPAGPLVRAEASWLDQTRLSAQEVYLGVRLDLGGHAEVVDELRGLADEHPLREELWALLMLALWRSGRRTEALEAYRRVRAGLLEDQGIEPGRRLRELQAAVLADDPTTAAPRCVPASRRPEMASPGSDPGTVPVPAQLPADVPGFVGRAAQLARLDGMLADRDRGLVVISTIDGLTGVGKTALAVHWGHRAAPWFPDGQLFIDLRGYSAGPPVRPIEALARLLRALGVRAADVPDGLDEAAALYRSRLSGRRVLVTLDNAHGVDQVRPLLPGTPGCMVVVTSRDQLAGLIAQQGAARLVLDVLAPGQAHELLTALAGTERADLDRAATSALAAACGYLPLALRVAAARLVTDPALSVGDYLDQLRAGQRLAALEVPGDPNAAVRSALDQSYAALPPAARHLYRLLSLVPGPHFTVPVSAALADLPRTEAARLLDRLATANLVDEHSPERYSFHDLVRDHAAGRAQRTDTGPARRGALARLYVYYLRTVTTAGDHLYPQLLRAPFTAEQHVGVVMSGDPSSREQSLAWLDVERPNLVAAVLAAGGHGLNTAAWQLADALRGYLYMGMHTVDWSSVATAGRAAAAADGDPIARAASHVGLASLHWVQGRHTEAVEQFSAALPLARRAGWAAGEAATLGNLGNLSWALGRLTQAADYYDQACALHRESGNPASEATALGNLGLVHFGLGNLDLAAEHYAEALRLHRANDSLGAEARTLTNLGAAYHAMGRLDDALDVLTQARALLDKVGDRNVEGDLLRHLAAVHRDAGRYAQALDLAGAAVDLARDCGDRRLEAGGLITVASIHTRLGLADLATSACRPAVVMARATDSRLFEAEALVELAAARRSAGDLDEAVSRAGEALTLIRADGYGLLEGRCRELLAGGAGLSVVSTPGRTR